MNRLRRLIREIHRRSLWQVLGVYVLASWAVLGGVGTLGDVLGLPDWFPRLALGLLIVGLPIVLATAIVQEGGPGSQADEGADGPLAEPAEGHSAASRLFTWRKAFTGGVLAFALWGVVAAGWTVFGGASRPSETAMEASAADAGERRLVVLPLENLTDDTELDVIGRLAADAIAREIDRRQPVAVVPSATLATTLRGLGENPSLDVVADAVRATHVFAGTVGRIGDQLRFEMELIDPSTSERLRFVDPVAGPSSEIDSLVTELTGRAAAEAVVAFNPTAAPWVGDMSSPASAAAYQAFTEQMDAFCEGNYPAAIEAGRRATRESPDFVASLYNLLLAYANAGQQEAPVADSLRAVLEGLRGQMTPNEELSIDSRFAWWDGDMVRAERAIDEAYRLDPVGRAGGAMEIKLAVGKIQEAERLFTELDLPGACPFPGFYLRGARIYHLLGRYQDEIDVARSALGLYEYDPRLLTFEARALLALGRQQEADSVLRVMDVRLPAPAALQAKMILLQEVRTHGSEEAVDSLADALLAQLSPAPRAWSAAYPRAVVLVVAGRWDEAYATLQVDDLEEALSESTGRQSDMGVVLAFTGRREEAMAMRERIAISGESDRADRYFGEARIMAALGDATEAARLLDASGRAVDDNIHVDPSFDLIRSDPAFVALTTPR